MTTAPAPAAPALKPGFYYVGYITAASLASMPTDEMRKRWPLGCPMSNTKPKTTRAAAKAEARRHHLRDVTVTEV